MKNWYQSARFTSLIRVRIGYLVESHELVHRCLYLYFKDYKISLGKNFLILFLIMYVVYTQHSKVLFYFFYIESED